jgi:hypothetical protein
MVDRRKLRCCGYLIGLECNRKPISKGKMVLRGAGNRKGEDRIEGAFVKGVERKG